ncbi:MULTISPECIES: STAS domain-containing protein [Sporosarcina]|nr:STAS domain-containing protein [Sporosarcina psychrophila]
METEKLALTDKCLKQAIAKLHLHLTEEQIAKHKELLTVLISEFSKTLLSSNEEIEDMNLEYDIDNYYYKDGTLLKDTIEIISTFRLSLMQEIQKKGLLEQYDTEGVAKLYEKITFVFDDAIRNTTKKFNESNQKVIKAIEKEILQLAAPIVPIRDGIAILPLIGDFSEERSAYITNTVIPKVTKLNIELLVIDFSGIHAIDTYVAQHVFQIIDILKLLGIETVITGVRPQLAMTTVELGINTKNLKTYGNVQQFLETFDKKEQV